jgi:hypothetical protein
MYNVGMTPSHFTRGERARRRYTDFVKIMFREKWAMQEGDG